MAIGVSIVRASGLLTFTGVAVDTQTVVVGGKTYTFQDTLTDVDGNVHVGADAAADIQNLLNAINLGPGAGTDYAASMTANAGVYAVSGSATILTVEALTPGLVGNLIASTETLANASWGAVVLENGAGDIDAWVTSLLALNQVNSEVMFELKKLTVAAD